MDGYHPAMAQSFAPTHGSGPVTQRPPSGPPSQRSRPSSRPHSRTSSRPPSTDSRGNYIKNISMDPDKISGASSLKAITPGAIDLDASRLSNTSTMSAVTLGGSHYPIGTTVGSSGLFVIGDPATDSGSRSRSMTSLNTNYSIRQLISSRGYDFEDWNWPVIRFSCLVVLISVMVMLLCAVIGLTIESRGTCDVRWKWWQGGLMYRINVEEFRDVYNRDSIGDFQGITERSTYLKDLGTSVVILNHIFASVSPRFDRVTSFKRVDPRLGDIQDFRQMVDNLYAADIKIMMEIDPTVTSTEHEWFLESRTQDSISGNDYKDLYVWQSQQPDTVNWRYNSLRNQYYLINNETEEAVLNWNDPNVRLKFKDSLTFWLNEGVDGFHIKNLENLHGTDIATTYEIITIWRDELDFICPQERECVLMVDDHYIRGTGSMMEQVLSKVDLVDQPFLLNPKNLTSTLQQVLSNLNWWQGMFDVEYDVWPSLRWTNMSTITMQYWSAVELFLVSMPGSPCLHAGQEIGRDPHEDRYRVYDRQNVALMTWTTGDNPLLYQAGSSLDVTSLTPLRKAISTRKVSPSLRANYFIEGEADEKLTYRIRDITTSILFIERSYRYFSKFYLVVNLGELKATSDWSDIVPSGSIIAESSGQLTGSVLFNDFLIQAGQAFLVMFEKD